MLLLTAGLVSFSLRSLLRELDWLGQLNLELAMRGLVGAVLLFNVYSLYQHITITRFRRGLLEQQVLVEQFRELAMFDPLTGLFNRRFGDERLNAEIARSQRRGNPLTMLVFDLNNFKQVNDSYGHGVGDLVLKQFAERLQRAIRGSDLAVRVGGDEFQLLLPDCRLEHVQAVLSRLTPMEITVNGQRIPITFSAGWADYQAGESRERFLERADHALYLQKRAGSSAATAPTTVT